MTFYKTLKLTKTQFGARFPAKPGDKVEEKDFVLSVSKEAKMTEPAVKTVYQYLLAKYNQEIIASGVPNQAN